MESIGLQGTLLIAVLIFGSSLVIAEDNQSIKNANIIETSQDESVKNCGFVTHDCEVCSVGTDGTVICSSIGFACQPARWYCLVPNGIQPQQ